MVEGDGFEKLILLGDLMTLLVWAVGPFLLTAVLTEVSIDEGDGREG
jgi:hypothetical protein